MATRKSKYDGKFNVGHRFGKWTVVTGEIYGSPATIDVTCQCGTSKGVDVYTLVNGKSTSCGCIVRTGSLAPNWKGVSDVPATLLYRNTLRASSHGDVQLNYAQLADVYNAQSATCVITGLTLTPETAKLERYDISGSFSTNNIGWVHTSVSPLASQQGIQGVITTSNTIVSNTSQQNNIFDKLGFKPN